MRSVYFVTGNPFKLEIARKVLEKSGIRVVQEKLETPEIQSTDPVEIASFSARWAAEKLNKPIVLTDAGYYIRALNGFPGPFIKYINQWLTAEDLLRLMEKKEDRIVEVFGCLAYCEPGKKVVTFESKVTGKIAKKAVKTDKPGSTPINEIFIPEGFDKVETEISREEMVKFWAQVENYWEKLADYLKKSAHES